MSAKSSRQDDIDARIQAYYGGVFDESVRLTSRSAQGPLEFQRTQEIVRERCSSGRIVDIGGGAGIHARALQDDGYDVRLIDPVPGHVEQARGVGVEADVADARDLPFADDSFDAALLLGPLYHLAERSDRMRAVEEAARVVRPGGFVFAGALSRYIAFGEAALGRETPSPYPGEWVSLAAEGRPSSGMRFPAGHFHTSEELQAELAQAGLNVQGVLGVEGPGGLLLEQAEGSDELTAAALSIARAGEAVPGIRDMSAHLIGIGVVIS